MSGYYCQPVHPSPDQFSGQAQKLGARHEWVSGQLEHVAGNNK